MNVATMFEHHRQQTQRTERIKYTLLTEIQDSKQNYHLRAEEDVHGHLVPDTRYQLDHLMFYESAEVPSLPVRLLRHHLTHYSQ